MRALLESRTEARRGGREERAPMLFARDLMTRAAATLGPRATLRHAVELLETLDIRHLPVVDEDGRLCGMLSDRDLRGLELASFAGHEHVGTLRSALDAQVGRFMSSEVVSVDVGADAAEIIDLMLDHKLGAIAVTGAQGELVGIVSYVDLLRRFPMECEAAE